MLFKNCDLLNLFIFSPTLGLKEGEECRKILYYYPHSTDESVQIKCTGLSEAIIKFTRSFNANTKCKWIYSERMMQFCYEAEEDYWIVMTVGQMEYNRNNQISNNWNCNGEIYSRQLVQLYQMCQLFIGSFASLLVKCNADIRLFKEKLLHFMSSCVEDLKMNKCNSVSIIQGVNFLPLDKKAYLHVQSFVRSFHHLFELEVDFCILFFKHHIVWTNLDKTTVRTIYNLLINKLINTNISDETEGLSSSESKFYLNNINKLSSCTKLRYMVSASANCTIGDIDQKDDVKLLPYQFLQFSINGTLFHLIVYNIFSSTFCMFVNSNHKMSSDLLNKIEYFLCQQMDTLATELSLVNKYIRKDEEQKVVVCFNKLNYAQKSTINNGLVKLPTEMINWLVDSCSKRDEIDNEIRETMIKTNDDHWIIEKQCNSRLIYTTIQDKNANLVEINDDIHRIYEKQMRSVFFSY